MEQIQTIVLDENIFFLNTLEKHLGHMDCVTVVTTSHYVPDLISKIRHLVPDLLIFNLDLHTINPLQFSEQVKKRKPEIQNHCLRQCGCQFLCKGYLS
jgi:two-component SAPR family response regulator